MFVGTHDDFIEYITETLIPDLKTSKMDATAEDFETLVDMIQLPSKLARAIRIHYFEDTPAPGFTVSMIDEGKWYASVNRFIGRTKNVVCNASAVSELQVLQLLTKNWLESIEKESLDDVVKA